MLKKKITKYEFKSYSRYCSLFMLIGLSKLEIFILLLLIFHFRISTRTIGRKIKFLYKYYLTKGL